MKLELFQIDAFADTVFSGNPAAVCPLTQWLPDELMQAIAAENNLSETVFFVPDGAGFQIRWFTPVTEVDLCGHATLAAAHVIFQRYKIVSPAIRFDSRSGPLAVKRVGQKFQLDFPRQRPIRCDIPAQLQQAVRNIEIKDCLKAADYVVLLEHESVLAALEPDLALLKQLDLRGVAFTAASDRYDFVCRFFAPAYGIDEDPVTGSAYTQLVPYWSERLARTIFHVRQISKRGGELWCELSNERVLIAGYTVQYMRGTINV